MTIYKNTMTLEDKERDRILLTLVSIKGIAQKIAHAFYEIGIRSPTDLAQYMAQHTTDQVLGDLSEHDVELKPWMIEKWDWGGQAKKLAQSANIADTPPEEKPRVEKAPETASKDSAWRQHAGFSVFFDFMLDEKGDSIWRTRVYHNESGDENSIDVEEPEPTAQEDFAGLDTAPWVRWILSRTRISQALQDSPTELKIVPKVISTEPKETLPAELLPQEDAQIDILDVQIREIESPDQFPKKELMAQIHFKISGISSESLATQGTLFQVQVNTLDLESRTSSLLVSKWDQLVPGKVDYTYKLALPFPDLGRYELQSIVLLPLPEKVAACHHSRILQVLP